MDSKKTILIFTDKTNHAVADALNETTVGDRALRTLVITTDDLRNRFIVWMSDKLAKEGGKIRDKILQFHFKYGYRLSGKVNEKKVVFRKHSARHRYMHNAISRFMPNAIIVVGHSLMLPAIVAVEKVKPDCLIASVGEDFVLDKRAVYPQVGEYYVDNFDMRQDLLSLNVPEEKINVVPLPVTAKFYKNYERADEIKKFGINEEKMTVLIVTSNLGDDRFEAVLDGLSELHGDMNVVVACGKNDKLREAARNKGLIAFTEAIRMEYALDLADIVVTRPTSIVIREALVRDKKVLCVYPYNILEERTADYLGVDMVLKAADATEACDKIKAYHEFYKAQQIEEIEETAPEAAPSLTDMVDNKDKVAEPPVEPVAKEKSLTDIIDEREEEKLRLERKTVNNPFKEIEDKLETLDKTPTARKIIDMIVSKLK